MPTLLMKQKWMTEKERKTWDAIYANIEEEDLDPQIVIDKQYNGDTEKYLSDMANYYGIS